MEPLIGSASQEIENLRRDFRNDFAGVPDAALNWRPYPEGNTIAGLVAHMFDAANFLVDGSYTVRAIPTDGAGNVGTPVSTTFTIDTTAPPAPTISAGPADPTNATTASFSFSDTEPGVTFECRLDGGGYSSCSSPRAYAGLGDGSHTFRVRALDAATNTSTVNPFQTFERHDVGLQLSIKPQITEGGAVRLAIYIEDSSVVSGTSANKPRA